MSAPEAQNAKSPTEVVEEYISYLNHGGRPYNATALTGVPELDASVLKPYLAANPLPVAHQAPKRLNVLDVKASNPKDSVGSKKPRSFRALSWHVIREVSLGMFEGGMKYGFHNYRMAGVRASVYFDATLEHISSWWEGQDMDPDSRLSHVTKAIASLFVLRDAMIQGKWVDDRPPNFVDLDKFKADLQRDVVDPMFARYPNPVPAYTHVEMLEQMAKGEAGRDGHEAVNPYRQGGSGQKSPNAHKSATEKIAEALAKGLVPKGDGEELPPDAKADPAIHNGHFPPREPPSSFWTKRMQEDPDEWNGKEWVPKKQVDMSGEPPRGMGFMKDRALRNPDQDMADKEARALDKFIRTQPTTFTPPGRCSSNDVIAAAIHKGWHDDPPAKNSVDELPPGILPKD